ncbi:Piso0_005207 [Millerozyma farinosa CBS 7064]|uniref:Piso0_005207 protein n=1 Tax=Pichia sorbitophila (strain ATCC MYA-4447 / BCRC 22081 / CBS 7064 / NBRC 10061 / NRRL Y-12695) TaxID=559304 RepID=G8Y4H7_PICSO|nr:Piso0_005207 [Millerozyma farinosa CBS 7064]
MQLIVVLLAQFLTCINLASCLNNEDIVSRIVTTHKSLTEKGPTHDVLDEYTILLRDISGLERDSDVEIIKQLPQIYYKKALIEISLNKETSAVEDLRKCLELNAHMKPAKERLISILLEKGDFEGLKPLITEKSDEQVAKTIDSVKGALAEAQQKQKSNMFQDCVDTLESKVMSVTSLNADALKLHTKCLEHLFEEKQSDEERVAVSKEIANDMNKLIKLQPFSNLETYATFSQYMMFTEIKFETAWAAVKNCLKVDNEYKSCTSLSKFYSRFSEVFKALEKYSIDLGYLYLVSDSEDESFKENLNENYDYKYIATFLLNDPLKISKSERKTVPSHVKTNYDYLTHRALLFAQERWGSDKQLENLKFKKDLDKLVCESLMITKHVASGRTFCSKVNENKEALFLPKHIPEIDKLLKERNYDKAKAYMDKFKKNVKQSKLFLSRYKYIEKHMGEQQRHHQHQRQQHFYQQQQEQQRRWQEQHQQQQMFDNSRKSGMDYYKVLGVPRNADDKEIRKAYRAQTLKYHPDKYKGNDMTPDQIEKKMQEINEAYETLSNKESREIYDRGEDQNSPGGGQFRGHRQPFQGRPHGNQFNFNQDFFRQFTKQQGGFKFGGFGGFGSQERVRVKKNKQKAP